VHVAFELSKNTWKVGILLPGSAKSSHYAIAGGDLAELTKLLALARERAERSSGKPIRMLSCYEAGYDGHWLHRLLTDQGVIIMRSIRRASRSAGVRDVPRPTGSTWRS
jgi:transposase